MLIFEKAPFPSCHASTVVEAEPGRLVAAWFGGQSEGAKDVQIWLSRFDGKTWTPPAVVGSEPGFPCWNPVLFRPEPGKLVLWYKAGPSPMTWTGYVRRSEDGGVNWSPPETLPAGFYGPVRAKPVRLANGTILAPTSLESHRNWTPYVDRSADGGATWKRSNPFPVAGSFGQIQPTLWEAKDGRVVALMRSKNPRRICRAESKDGGETFTAAVPTDLPNPNSGIDAVRTSAGDVFLVYNPTERGRFPLALARSTDDGATWRDVLELETMIGEYSYPAMVESAAGTLEITYTWNRTHIKHASVDPKKWR